MTAHCNHDMLRASWALTRSCVLIKACKRDLRNVQPGELARLLSQFPSRYLPAQKDVLADLYAKREFTKASTNASTLEIAASDDGHRYWLPQARSVPSVIKQAAEQREA